MRGRSKRRNKTGFFADVSIAEFANAEKASSGARISKAKLDDIIRMDSAGRSTAAEDDIDQDEAGEDIAQRHHAPRKMQSSKNEEAQATFFVYPFEFWEHLGHFVTPECVGVFARLCKATCEVVRRPAFWSRLYADYYRPMSSIPERLTPDCMERMLGLRCQVIRSLFYTYKPFSSRLQKGNHPNDLVESICENFWVEKTGDSRSNSLWSFCFKLRRPAVQSPRQKPRKKSSREDEVCDDFYNDRDLLADLDDVLFNPDESCALLEVHSMEYARFLPMVGMKLMKATLTVSGEGFRYQKLTMQFVPGHLRNCFSDDLVTIVIADVTFVKWHEWYHPRYGTLCTL